jgi:serine/tyrosine/threonine adenylyltransferase
VAKTLTAASPLPATFWKQAKPQPVAAARFVACNRPLAETLGLGADFFDIPHSLAALAGNAPWPDQASVALAYSGHQFGHWNPLMGDGRAHLIATLNGRLELQLKGSGATPFSRNGDGRAALGPMLREYIISEAFAGLGIPTTRTLAVVATGEQVYRRRVEPGAICARIATSHVRVGTFQFAAAHLGPVGVQTLYNHERARSHPTANTPIEFLSSVIARQADLIARWMAVGFIHGVMNTDNMAISGETIDFGPCAFMDRFHPKKVFSSIDERGRYAWDQQPAIGLWNLSRFAETLLPLLHESENEAVSLATAQLQHFYPRFEEQFEALMLAKLGIASRSAEDGAFIAAILRVLMDEAQDFTQFFRELTRGKCLSPHVEKLWRERLASAAPDMSLMQVSNPVYSARNHQVERALSEAEAGDMTRFNTLHSLLQTPFTEQQGAEAFEAPPLPDEEVPQTFCGT